jgi:hypothetical protein
MNYIDAEWEQDRKYNPQIILVPMPSRMINSFLSYKHLKAVTVSDRCYSRGTKYTFGE